MSSVHFHVKGRGFRPMNPNKLLEELCGQPELIKRLLHTFQAETQRDLDQLEAAIAVRDSATVTILAHRLKGSAATVGAESLEFRSAQVEGLGRQGNLEQVSDRMPGLHEEFERFCSFMQELGNLD